MFQLGFVPLGEWKPQKLSLQELQKIYFSSRNGVARHFSHKLCNALKITEKYPNAYSEVGVILIGKNLIKVNSRVFGSLLGIHAYQGGLFHKQGNFVRNGYKQIPKIKIDTSQMLQDADITDVDEYEVRIFTNTTNEF